MDPSTTTGRLALEDALHFARVTRYSHIAAYSLFVYEYLISFDEEVNYITSSSAKRSPQSSRTPISRAKIAYLCCRYWPLLTYPIIIWVQVFDHDRALCLKIFRIPMFITIFNIAGAAMILILRTCAVTKGRRLVAWTLAFCLASLATYQAIISATKASLIQIPIGCYPIDSGTGRYLSGYFIAPLVLDFIITITFTTYLVQSSAVRFTEMARFTKLFIRDGVVYFIAIAAIHIVNCAFNLQSNIPMATVAVPLSLLMANLLACRLVLNLRRTALTDGGHSGNTLSESSNAELEFDMPRYNHEEYMLGALGR